MTIGIDVDGVGRSFFLFGEFEHDVHHDLFDDAAESASPDALGVGFLGDGLQGRFGELQFALFHPKEGLVLFDESVLGFGEDFDQTCDVEGSEGGHDG